jgi:hypothetical protein
MTEAGILLQHRWMAWLVDREPFQRDGDICQMNSRRHANVPVDQPMA